MPKLREKDRLDEIDDKISKIKEIFQRIYIRDLRFDHEGNYYKSLINSL